MEIGNLSKLIKKNGFKMLLVATLFGLIGVSVYYAFPPRYTATGTFFVKRAVESSSGEFFNYEGYYSQQVSLSYAKTFAALLESVDIKSKALGTLQMPISDDTLRDINRKVRVKSATPQLVTLTVKGNSVGEATNVWAALSNAALQASESVNSGGDTSVKVVPLNTSPVVQMVYRNVYLNFLVGVLLGTLFCLIVLGVHLLAEEEDK